MLLRLPRLESLCSAVFLLNITGDFNLSQNSLVGAVLASWTSVVLAHRRGTEMALDWKARRGEARLGEATEEERGRGGAKCPWKASAAT